MRTTLVIDDRVFRRAKERAAALGSTVSDLVNQALREMLDEPRRRQTLDMITYGDKAKKVHHEPADFEEALVSDEAESLGR